MKATATVVLRFHPKVVLTALTKYWSFAVILILHESVFKMKSYRKFHIETKRKIFSQASSYTLEVPINIQYGDLTCLFKQAL